MTTVYKAASAGAVQGSAVADGLQGHLEGLWGGRYGLGKPERPGMGPGGGPPCKGTKERGWPSIPGLLQPLLMQPNLPPLTHLLFF